MSEADRLPPRRPGPAGGRLAWPAFLLAMLSACGSSAEPLAPRTPVDLSAPARLLADPFVASLPENLGSTSAHTALAAVLARAATAARAGDRDGLVAQLQRAAMLLEEHRGHVATGEAPASDLVALAALDVVRLRAATLLPAAPADAAR